MMKDEDKLSKEPRKVCVVDRPKNSLVIPLNMLSDWRQLFSGPVLSHSFPSSSTAQLCVVLKIVHVNFIPWLLPYLYFDLTEHLMTLVRVVLLEPCREACLSEWWRAHHSLVWSTCFIEMPLGLIYNSILWGCGNVHTCAPQVHFPPPHSGKQWVQLITYTK